MQRISRLRLASAQTTEKARFYVGVLGMTEVGANAFQYGPEEATLTFEPARGTYMPERNDLYWKIAISVPDLDRACEQLRARGVQIDGPRQFGDVGYLAHLRDPEGFGVELLQHEFKEASKPPLRDASALGGGPSLNLITLRATDIEPVQRLCQDQLGMTLLCTQIVDDFGFSLYFYAFTDELPPDPNPSGLANRTWTYQRPYTVLEVQHVYKMQSIRQTEDGLPGYLATEIDGAPPTQDLLLGLRSA